MSSVTKLRALMALLILFSGGSRLGYAEIETLVSVDVKTIYVPMGFDDNDRAEVVVEGYLPNPCHKLREPKVTREGDKKTIWVIPQAEHVVGICPDVVVPYHQVISLGVLPEGVFSIKAQGSTAGEKMTIKKAATPGPDDYLYAPVDSAYVDLNGQGKFELKLRGRFTNSCLQLEEVKMIDSGRILEVLPIMKKLERTPKGNPCEPKEVPFRYARELPDLAPGSYLVHVRTLNGNSVNEIFSNQWGE